jgi:hypothetical protein
MKKIYSAQNAIDAHIVKGMLEQQGISVRVDGEYLQGGIGELPLIGLVIVSVADEDYVKALELLREYESVES